MTTILIGILFVAATVGLTLGAYFLMRWATGGDPEGHQRDLAGSVVFRISALHGLILALVFAQEMVVYQQLKHEGAIETNAIANIFFDADRYGADEAKPIHQAVANYVHSVTNSEWALLGKIGRLDGEAWGYWGEAYDIILNLEPATPRQVSLRENMLRDVHTVAQSRIKRENHASNPMSSMFWFAAVAGVVLIAIGYYSYPPERHNLILISIFGAFTGVILFFIYSFANPYGGPGALNPSAYERLLDQMDQSGLLLGEPTAKAS